MKHPIITFIILSMISMSLAFFLHLLRPVHVPAEARGFLVSQGAGFLEIADKLAAEGLIRSPLLFKLYGATAGAGRTLKAGDYVLSADMSTPEILRVLVNGPEEDVAVVIPEGATLKDIDAALSRYGIIAEGALEDFSWRVMRDEFSFLKEARSLEGFLFPDTYRFFPQSPVESVARRMLENFETKAIPEIRGDVYDTLIIASLIEKEVPFHEDRRIVSGIIQNRLAIDMALQIDAAPVTYQRYGLPATPIANPGLDAISAAQSPAHTKYFYYLSDPKTHKTIFAETLDEHNENRWQYLRK